MQVRHPDVAVIVVNWNNWQLSLECLASLRTSVGVGWHLFLVDNASSDGSADHLVDLGRDVTVILSPANGGWTGGNNLGIEAALAAGYDRFFVLNNDATVEPDTLLRLSEDIATPPPPPPVLGPLQRNADGEMDFIGAAMDERAGMPRDLRAHRTDIARLPSIYDTSYIRGAGLFACREHFERVGLFDDAFYLYYDESDWCFRARAAGYRIAMTQHASIIHIGSVSLGGAQSPLVLYFMVRNSLLFARRHARPVQRLHQLVWLLRWIAAHWGEGSRAGRLWAMLFGRTPRARAVRAGVRDFMLGRLGDCPPAIRRLSGSR